jgi:hypothetical protein
MKPADISSLRALRRARDRIDRDYANPYHFPGSTVTAVGRRVAA